MTKILFVEDDQNLGMLLTENLNNRGFDIEWCKNGTDGLDKFKTGNYNLCIFDVMMPTKDGFTLTKEIKAIKPDMPVIFLTARNMQEDKIKGFELGCDDYVTKPFNTQELFLRINAILNRTQKDKPLADELHIGRYLLNTTKMTLELEGVSTKLSSKESGLLYILASNINVLVNRSAILEQVWGNDDYFSAKSMDVYISKVRKLLKEDPNIEILNAYGIGFKLIVNN
ncbi:MAG: response regulator transcription factor [Flavipsychrobacter sp.]